MTIRTVLEEGGGNVIEEGAESEKCQAEGRLKDSLRSTSEKF